MIKVYSDNEREREESTTWVTGFFISSKESFVCTIPHKMAFVMPALAGMRNSSMGPPCTMMTA